VRNITSNDSGTATLIIMGGELGWKKLEELPFLKIRLEKMEVFFLSDFFSCLVNFLSILSILTL